MLLGLNNTVKAAGTGLRGPYAVQLPASWFMEVQTGPIAACLSEGAGFLSVEKSTCQDTLLTGNAASLIAHQEASAGTEVALVD